MGKFSDDESAAILGAVDRGSSAALRLLEENIDAAMNTFNQDPARQDDQPQAL